MFLACRCNDSLSCVSLAEGFESISVKFTFLIVVLFSTSGPSSEYEELYVFFFCCCCFFFFYLYANVHRNVTWGMYYCLTTELDHAKRDSRLTAYGGVVLQRLEALNL